MLTLSWILKWGVTHLLCKQLDLDGESWAEGCFSPLLGLRVIFLCCHCVCCVSLVTSCLGSNLPLVIHVTGSWPWSHLAQAGWCLCCCSQQAVQCCVAQQLALPLCQTLYDVTLRKQPLFFLPSSQVSFPNELRVICSAHQGNVFMGWEWGYLCAFECSRKVVLGSWGWKKSGIQHWRSGCAERDRTDVTLLWFCLLLKWSLL